jgi:MFS family permease
MTWPRQAPFVIVLNRTYNTEPVIPSTSPPQESELESHPFRERVQEFIRHPLTLPCYLPSVALSFSGGLLVPILPLYVADFDISYGLIGLVLAGEGIGALLGDVPAGILLQRLGRKGSMLTGLTLIILSTGVLFWARAIPLVLFCRLCAGFGRALFAIARHAYVADATAVHRRGRAVALFGGIFRMGRFAGPAIGGTVAAAYGLRLPFLLYSGVCITAILSVLASVQIERDLPQEASRHLDHGGDGLVVTLRTHYRTLATAGAGQLFAQMVRAGRRVLIPLYAADVLGLDPQAIGLIETTSSAFDTAMFYPTGVIMDRWGRKYAVVPAFLILAAGLSLVPFTASFSGLMLVVALIGFGNGLSAGTMMTLGADLSPQEGRAQFLGVWRMIGDAGATGGPLIVGGVADLLTLQPAAWAVAATGLATSAIFAFLMPETLRKRPDQTSEV